MPILDLVIGKQGLLVQRSRHHGERATGRMNSAWRLVATVCVLVIGIYVYMAHSGVLELLSPTPAESYYNLLVEGFRAGHLSLKKKPPAGLTQLADPYNPAATAPFRLGSDPLLDMSYYKGSLHLYFGVTPALVLFWPVVALTGHYLSHVQAVTIFCAIGFLASVGLMRALWRRYFPEVSIWVVAACALALGLATGVPTILPRSDVYEVAISCGYMSMMLALGAIWCALHDAERRCRWLAAASLAYGLAVGARPNLLFGGLILLVPVAQAWRERRRIWSPLMAATGPIIFIGLGLMLYNTLRFNSPFEFGQRYQLGAEPQLTSQFFSLRYFWFNFRVYFLESVRWSSPFPFVHQITMPPLPAGYFGVQDPFGVLTSIPLVWLALAAPLTWWGRPQEAASILRWFVTAVCLLFGTCALTLVLHYSAACRYEVDFLPALMLLAVAGIFGVERMLADQPVWRRVARCGWGLLLIFSVVVNVLVGVENHAWACYSLGVTLARVGRVPEAIQAFEKSLRIKPDSAEAHMNLGNALLTEGKVQDATAHYEEALQIRPDYPLAHDNLGIALAQAGRMPEAMQHWEQALKLKPDDVEAHYKLGLALMRMGKASDAVWHYEQALRINPDYVEALNSLAWLLATRPPTENGDPAQSVVLAERACKLTHNRVATYLDTLAAGYAATGRFGDAVDTAQKAIRLTDFTVQTQLVSKIEMRLKLYQANRAYYESTNATSYSSP